MSEQDLTTKLKSGQNVSLTRQLAAIPYQGKDIPSGASQFSHPDVVIGLTVLAYRCEGLCFFDFENAPLELRERLDSEYGRYHERPSALRNVQWVECAGGKVRGPREGEIGNTDDPEALMRAPMNGKARGRGADDIWPSHLLDLKDDHHISVTYKLLRKSPKVVEFYLDSIVFPLTMEHNHKKISASGQDLNGQMLVGGRVEFSGPPLDLLREELGQCSYEQCIDGQIVHYLMTEFIVISCMLPADWSVTKLLDQIATVNPSFHVLLNVSALVAGRRNYQVVKYLLIQGLPDKFDGVVLLEDKE